MVAILSMPRQEGNDTLRAKLVEDIEETAVSSADSR